MKSKMITIGMPFYNAENYLKDAISSIINQDIKDWELILVNDGSTDRSLDVAKTFKDPRIKIFSDGDNKGLSSRLNQINEIAKFDLIARMDADDISAPNRLSEQLKKLAQGNSDICFTAMASIDKKNNFLGYRKPRDNTPTIYNLITGKHGINHATMLAKKSWLLRNKYNTEFKRSEDFELWLRSINNKDFNVCFVTKPLYFYRESINTNIKSILKSYFYCMKAIFLHRKKTPTLFTMASINIYIFKTIFMTILSKSMLKNSIINIRNRNLSPDLISGQNFIDSTIKEIQKIKKLP